MNKTFPVRYTSEDDIINSIQELTLTLKKHVSPDIFRNIISDCAIIEKNKNKCDVLLYLIKVVEDIFNEKETDSETLLKKLHYSEKSIQREISTRYEEEDSNTELKNEVKALKKSLVEYKKKEFSSSSILVHLDKLKEDTEILQNQNAKLEFTISTLNQKNQILLDKIVKNDYVAMESLVSDLTKIITNFNKKNTNQRYTENYITGRIQKNLTLWNEYKKLAEDLNCDIDQKVKNLFQTNRIFLEEQLHSLEENTLENKLQPVTPIETTKMDEVKIGLCKLVMNNIPIYNSDECDKNQESLNNFLFVTNFLSESVNEANISDYIQLITNLKLRGAAHNWFLGKTFVTFEEFKKEISARFAKQVSVEDLLLEIQSIRQNANETVEDFGHRVTQLVKLMEAGYSKRYGDMGKISLVSDMSLLSFEQGLLEDRVKIFLSTTKPATLEEAISSAVQFSKLTNRLTKRVEASACPEISIEVCQLCKNNGHLAINCPLLKTKTMSSIPNNTRCQLCNDIGHEARDCKILNRGNMTQPKHNYNNSNLARNTYNGNSNNRYNSTQNRQNFNSNHNVNGNMNHRQNYNSDNSGNRGQNDTISNNQNSQNSLNRQNSHLDGSNLQNSFNNNSTGQHNGVKVMCFGCGNSDHVLTNCEAVKNIMTKINQAGNEERRT